MARTYSSGILPPPNGGGVSSPLPCPVRCALVSTLLTIRLAVGASDDLGCPLPTPLLQQSLQKGRVLLIGGCPPPPLGQGFPPSLSPAGLSQGARVSAQAPPPTPSPGCAMWERTAWWGCPPPLPWMSVVSARWWVGGTPPSYVPWMRSGGARCLVGVSPLAPGCTRVARAAGWEVPPLPPSPDCAMGERAARSGCPPLPPGYVW